ncbi:hypothetical protein EV361DRAFT_892558 [Lentinula raphanica]|nr:hypothetical protein EV361DRAFT_892558 [Lentinula raphanica]
MGPTELRHPDKIFTTAPPAPPPWPTASIFLSSNLTPRTLPSVQWKPSSTTLRWTISYLQTSLRSLHKRKIPWPIEDPHSTSNLSPNDYLMMLLQPIPIIFNELNPPKYFKKPMECIPIDLGHSIFGATFVLEEIKLWQLVAAPIVVPLPGDFFNPTGQIHPDVEFAVSLALEHSPTATIILTNFTDIVIFLPGCTRSHPEPTFERISTTQPSLALRVLATAYLLAIEDIPRYLLNTPPPPEWDVSDALKNLQGPPQDPNQLLPDDEVFATHHRHSDFDMVTLVQDSSRALQFFRWHKHISETVSKVVAHPHDPLTAKTNEFDLAATESRPLYPFDSSEIPPDTADHLQAIQRESPLAAAGVENQLKSSKFFTIDIEDVIDEGSERGICTVYRCRITTIDDVPVSTPSLCLKLFDDRFQRLRSPEDDEDEETDDEEADEPNNEEADDAKRADDQPNSTVTELNGISFHVAIPAQLKGEDFENDLRTWLAPAVHAETYAMIEVFAYDKLLPVQGSVVPWFYGIHQFKLPDGTILYDLLMEYIEGWKLETTATRELSPERQIKMIRASVTQRASSTLLTSSNTIGTPNNSSFVPILRRRSIMLFSLISHQQRKHGMPMNRSTFQTTFICSVWCCPVKMSKGLLGSVESSYGIILERQMIGIQLQLGSGTGLCELEICLIISSHFECEWQEFVDLACNF